MRPELYKGDKTWCILILKCLLYTYSISFHVNMLLSPPQKFYMIVLLYVKVLEKIVQQLKYLRAYDNVISVLSDPHLDIYSYLDEVYQYLYHLRNLNL